MNLGFIGLGKMSSAIIKGLRNSETFADQKIYASSRNQAKLKENCKILEINACKNNQDCIAHSDIVFLGVEPESLSKLEIDLEGKIIISMAAKTKIKELVKLFGDQSIMRIMPNLNVSINEGTIAYNAYQIAEDTKRKLVHLLSVLGDLYEIEESQFSAFIALAGSSPALIYYFIDALSKSGIEAGFSKEEALEIVSKTMIGSASYLMESKVDPQTLINNVSSIGGTTIEGLKVLEENNFEEILLKSAQAIIEKDKKG